MRTTTAIFKQIMATGNARHYLFNIVMTLADNTELTLTENDIWEDSFSIDTASSSTSTFDLGAAIIGKCSFTINNINGDFDSYDFFNANAVVWVGLEGDIVNNTQQYYRMGFYTVDEPQKANGLISLELLDNMWKFDRPFEDVNITYPATARSIVQSLCSYCGVQLSANSQQFHGYGFSIAEAPKDTSNMNCREMLQYIAMIGCNFCVINDTGQLEIKWYNTSATTETTAVFERNMSTSCGTDEIEITGVKFIVDKTEHKIGTNGYVLELDNPLVTASNVNAVLNLIWDVLDGFTLRTFNITTASDLSAEIGDKCKIKGYKGAYYYSWITLNTFKTAGHLIQCNAEAPNRTLVTRYSKSVQSAVEEARRTAGEVISNYDLTVQELNNLANQAMGAYSDYEDLATGGRIYYISNMPITKDPTTGACSFQANSIVWRMAGDVFTVSTDGGQTWQNGYNPSTGQLVVNVLSSIGIQFDWARGGTLTLGGYGNGNGVCEVKDSTNNTVVRIDNAGITMYSGLLQSPDYREYTPVETYSNRGLMLDVINKVFKSPYFAINTDGAFFKGTIQITGDLDIGTDSFDFRPTDYYLAVDFDLKFETTPEYEGSTDVVVELHTFTESQGQWVESVTTIDEFTLTDDTPYLSTGYSHTVGQNGKDFYRIIKESSYPQTTVYTSVDNAILAYVGNEGFRGFLEGIFKGYVETDAGRIAGLNYGSGTSASYVGANPNGLFRTNDNYEFSMIDGFFRPNGALLRLYDNVFNFGNADGIITVFKSDSQGGGADGAVVKIDGYNQTIIKTDAQGVPNGSVMWNTDIQTSTTDSPPASLADGHLFLVYE